jgi:hypothetical protein
LILNFAEHCRSAARWATPENRKVPGHRVALDDWFGFFIVSSKQSRNSKAAPFDISPVVHSAAQVDNASV